MSIEEIPPAPDCLDFRSILGRITLKEERGIRVPQDSAACVLRLPVSSTWLERTGRPKQEGSFTRRQNKSSTFENYLDSPTPRREERRLPVLNTQLTCSIPIVHMHLTRHDRFDRKSISYLIYYAYRI
jgi:hypothetical protein